MRDWDSEDESSFDGSTNTAGTENGDSSGGNIVSLFLSQVLKYRLMNFVMLAESHKKQKVQKLIEAAKVFLLTSWLSQT